MADSHECLTFKGEMWRTSENPLSARPNGTAAFCGAEVSQFISRRNETHPTPRNMSVHRLRAPAIKNLNKSPIADIYPFAPRRTGCRSRTSSPEPTSSFGAASHGARGTQCDYFIVALKLNTPPDAETVAVWRFSSRVPSDYYGWCEAADEPRA